MCLYGYHGTRLVSHHVAMHPPIVLLLPHNPVDPPPASPPSHQFMDRLSSSDLHHLVLIFGLKAPEAVMEAIMAGNQDPDLSSLK